MRHRFHALCPYFAMFPESFVEGWLTKLTRPGDLILDPFCGRGTTPFQSILMGRAAVANDINPVAYCITRAKTNAPSRASVLGRIAQLEARWPGTSHRPLPRERLGEFFRVAYRRGTLQQILFLRRALRWRKSNVDCMLAALVLGSLHGESERSGKYLSNQMPRTISTKPAYSVRFWRRHGYQAPRRDVFDVLRTMTGYRYETGTPDASADVLLGDMREIPCVKDLRGRVQAVITSPPYLDITRFEEDQWLRLWFLGGPPHPTTNRVSRDDRHSSPAKYWGLIADLWRSLGRVCAPKANVVLRIGGKGLAPEQLADGLLGTSVCAGRRARLVSQSVSEIRGRQTSAFLPNARGCRVEVDCHFVLA